MTKSIYFNLLKNETSIYKDELSYVEKTDNLKTMDDVIVLAKDIINYQEKDQEQKLEENDVKSENKKSDDDNQNEKDNYSDSKKDDDNNEDDNQNSDDNPDEGDNTDEDNSNLEMVGNGVIMMLHFQ